MCLSTSIAFETKNPMGVPIRTTLLCPMYVTPPKYTHYVTPQSPTSRSPSAFGNNTKIVMACNASAVKRGIAVALIPTSIKKSKVHSAFQSGEQ